MQQLHGEAVRSSWESVVIPKENNRDNIVSIQTDFQYSDCIKLCYIS